MWQSVIYLKRSEQEYIIIRGVTVNVNPLTHAINLNINLSKENAVLYYYYIIFLIM